MHKREVKYDLDKKYVKQQERNGSPNEGFRIIPYSLSPNQMEFFFGFKPKAIYDLIHTGKLHRGYHYLKVGKKVVIICEKFIEWMEVYDGGQSTR
jgi:hypothetical protein